MAWQMEGKTGPCAAFDVGVVGQDTNTMQGASSISGVGTGVGLTLSMDAGMELVVSAGIGAETEVLQVAGSMQAFCSQWQTWVCKAQSSFLLNECALVMTAEV